MEYTKEYFIEKFSAIPEDKWCTGAYIKGRKCCALGHCGARNTYDLFNEIPMALINLVGNAGEFSVPNLNDGTHVISLEYGSSPKERIINYLKSL